MVFLQGQLQFSHYLLARYTWFSSLFPFCFVLKIRFLFILLVKVYDYNMNEFLYRHWDTQKLSLLSTQVNLWTLIHVRSRFRFEGNQNIFCPASHSAPSILIPFCRSLSCFYLQYTIFLNLIKRYSIISIYLRVSFLHH